MKFAWRTFVIIGIVGVIASLGCGKNPKPETAKSTVTSEVPLPSWAPENPSPEFLRAARVFKPIPEEAKSYSPMYLVAWEFFGSLSDEQIAEFQERKQISRPISAVDPGVRDYLMKKVGAREVNGQLVYNTHNVNVEYKSFSPQQRKLFDNIVKAWAESGTEADQKDLLVLLYKWGAKKDLSNVTIGFNILGGHAVNLNISATTTISATNARSAGTGVWIAQF